jgi:hypothetical protein
MWKARVPSISVTGASGNPLDVDGDGGIATGVWTMTNRPGRHADRDASRENSRGWSPFLGAD